MTERLIVRPLLFLVVCAIASFAPCGSPPLSAQDGEELDWGVGEEDLVLGKYRTAIIAYRDALAGDPESVGDRYGLALTLLETGEYEEAAKLAAGLVSSVPKQNAYHLLAARVAVRRGRYDEAKATFNRVIERDPKSFEAHARLGRLLASRGESDAARRAFRVPELVASETVVKEPEALVYLGWCYQALGRLEDASKVYVEARKEDPELYAAHVALIRVALQNNSVFGSRPYYIRAREEALRNNPHQPDVHLAMADVYVVRNEFRNARESLEKALAANPNLVHGLCLHASFAVDRMDFKGAAQTLSRAEAICPGDLEVASYRAALHYIRGDVKSASTGWETILRTDPDYGECYYIVAEMLNNLRRYAEAYGFAKKATEVSPTMWRAWDSYARYALHTGREEEAIKALRHADRNDRGGVVPWRSNMLELFSHADEFLVHKWGPFILRLHASDNPVMKRYVVEALDEAYRVLSKKYRFEPATPIRVSIFNDQKDFAVRTVGVPGIFGVLGACFGQVITMNSPRALPAGSYVWKATLWHEFAHVITLQMSDYRVSRWLTEGLSVYEEKCQNPAWEEPQDQDLYNALQNGELAPIKHLDGYFRTAKIGFAYLQSLHLVEFIIAEHGGFEKLLAMLKSYARGYDTVGVLKDVFGLTPEAFDAAFERYVARRFEQKKIQVMRSEEAYAKARDVLDLDPKDLESLRVVAWYHYQRGERGKVDCEAALARLLSVKPDDPAALALRGELALRDGKSERAKRFFEKARGLGWDEFYMRLNLGRMRLAAGDTDGAIEHFEAAKALFPRYAGQGNPYLALAELYRKQDKKDEARKELEAFAALQATDTEGRLELAKHYQSIGDHDTALRYGREVIQVTPFDPVAHRVLSESLAATDRLSDALDEIALALLLLEESEKKSEAAKKMVPALRLARAEILRKMGKEADAVKEAKAALLAHPDHEGLRAFVR